MKTMKFTFRLALILYICAFLTGAPFVLSASAKITPKSVAEETKLITIEKGHTLWSLAGIYFKHSALWQEFGKYNNFTDPDLIYPGEKMQLPGKFVMSADSARAVLQIIEDDMSVSKEDVDAVQRELKEAGVDWTSTKNAVLELKGQVEALQTRQSIGLSGASKRSKRQHKMGEEIKKATQMNSETIEQLSKSLMSQSEASKMDIKSLSKQIEELQAQVSQKTAELHERQEHLEMMSADTHSLAEQMAQNQKSLQNSQPIAEEPEKPSTGTRTFAILAAAAGGIAWFAVNAIGRSD